MFYPLLYWFLRVVMWFWHPVIKVSGKEHVKEDEHYIICANHVGAADPIWIVVALKARTLKKLPRIMAKIELMRVPVIGKILELVGVFGVDRGESDVASLKTALKTLKSGKSLLIFPQGTRCRNSDRLPGKTGAAMLATRTESKVLPIYISEKRRPFSVIRCVIGEPYTMKHEGKRATSGELRVLTDELMDRIYKLGDSL